MYSVRCRIEGVAPGLLMHKFSTGAQAETEAEVKKAKRDFGTPKAQAQEVAYYNEDGKLVQPAEHIYQSLVKAAGDFQVKGKGKKSYRDAVRGLVLVAPEYIGHDTQDWTVDSRPVRVQKARVVRHRPFLAKWSLNFELKCLDGEALPAEVMNAILVRAGESVGIGDYRPRFGRFLVTEFKKLAA